MIPAVFSFLLAVLLVGLELFFPTAIDWAREYHVMALVGQAVMALCWVLTEHELIRERRWRT